MKGSEEHGRETAKVWWGSLAFEGFGGIPIQLDAPKCPDPELSLARHHPRSPGNSSCASPPLSSWYSTL